MMNMDQMLNMLEIESCVQVRSQSMQKHHQSCKPHLMQLVVEAESFPKAIGLTLNEGGNVLPWPSLSTTGINCFTCGHASS